MDWKERKNALRYAALSSFRFDRFHQSDDR
jgi:hypothetical protein